MYECYHKVLLQKAPETEARDLRSISGSDTKYFSVLGQYIPLFWSPIII